MMQPSKRGEILFLDVRVNKTVWPPVVGEDDQLGRAVDLREEDPAKAIGGLLDFFNLDVFQLLAGLAAVRPGQNMKTAERERIGIIVHADFKLNLAEVLRDEPADDDG